MQTRKALKALSKNKIVRQPVENDGPLAQHSEYLIDKYNKHQASIKAEQERHDIIASMPALQAARTKLDDMIGNKAIPDDTPIVSRFDAFSVIKNASKKDHNDQGLHKLAIHLERLWHKDPLGVITAGTLSHLRDHYQYNNPRSILGEVVDTVIPTVSFNTLPVAKLVRIASQVTSQEDYNIAITNNSLGGDSPKHVRARTFIRALINQRQAADACDAAPKTMEEQQVSDIENEQGQFNKFKRVRPPLVKGAKITGNDIAARVAARIQKIAGDTSLEMPPEVEIKADSECDKKSAPTDENQDIKSEDLGIQGSGMLPVTAEMIKTASNGSGFIADKEGVGLSPDPIGQPSPFETGHHTIEDIINIATHAVEDAKKYPQIAQLVVKMGVDPNSPNAIMEIRNVVSHNQKAYNIFKSIPQVMGKIVQQEESAAQRAAYKHIAKDLDDPESEDLYPEEIEAITESFRHHMEDTPDEPMEMSAAKDKKNKKNKKNPMEVKVNEQQPDQVTVPENVLKKQTKLTQKRPSLKAAITANHPLVDDAMDHLPIYTPQLAKISANFVNNLMVSPDWWLGSVDELKSTLRNSLYMKASEYEAGKMPPQLMKNMFGKEEGEEEEDKSPPFGKGKGKGKGKAPPFGKDKGKKKLDLLKKKKGDIESHILNGNEYNNSGYSIAITDNGVTIHSKRGSKNYQLLEMDSAIDDFIYLAGTTDDPYHDSPPPTFYIREGMRLKCPACYTINNYIMPKTASELSCGECNTILPIQAVASAFDVGAAANESVLVATISNPLQETYGDIFAKAAEKLGADAIDVNGNTAEAFVVNASDDIKAEVWDFLVQAGFKPIALDVGDIDLPPELPQIEQSKSMESGIEYSEAYIKGVINHYKNSGLATNANDAISKFISEYKADFVAEKYNAQLIIDVASEVFGSTPSMEVLAMLQKYALTDPKVNAQQPDAVKVPGKVLGPESESKHFTIPKPKTQITPQGTFAEVGTEEGSDSRDPKDFGAGKPKAQHPATDQKGVSLSDTNLGKDSETDTGLTKKMESTSKAAPGALRSK